jgi:ribosome-dependent ATPase
MFNFVLMTLLAITIFAVPVKGSFLTLALASFIFTIIATGMGLLASIFTTSQIAAIFMTTIGTMLPVMQFAGLLDPVSSLEGMGRLIGQIYPATHMITISRGVFNKALSLGDLYASFLPMIAALPVILGLSVFMLKKQEA